MLTGHVEESGCRDKEGAGGLLLGAGLPSGLGEGCGGGVEGFVAWEWVGASWCCGVPELSECGGGVSLGMAGVVCWLEGECRISPDAGMGASLLAVAFGLDRLVRIGGG